MNIITRYVCACCHTMYSDREAALKCELGHKSPVGIEALRYASIANDSTGYPVVVQVKMSDGRSVQYKRLREA